MAKKEVAKQEDQFPTEVPDYLKNQGGVGRGNEDVSSDDMSIPRLEIIQDLSPQHKKSKEEYIEGAEAGMCFNTATNELYPAQVTLVPVFFRKEFVVWKHRKAGGGFGGAFESAAEAARQIASLPDGGQTVEGGDPLYEAVETHQQFCLLIGEDGTMEEIVLSMGKSKRSVSKKWNTTIRSMGGDRFSRAYRAEVVPAQNANGDDYYNWKINPLGFVSEKIYRAAEQMYESVSAGLRDVNRNPDSDTDGVAQAVDHGEDEFSDV